MKTLDEVIRAAREKYDEMSARAMQDFEDSLDLGIDVWELEELRVEQVKRMTAAWKDIEVQLRRNLHAWFARRFPARRSARSAAQRHVAIAG